MTLKNEINSLRAQQITPEIKYAYYRLKILADDLNGRVFNFWNLIVSGSKSQLDVKLNLIDENIVELETASARLNKELESLKHWILDNVKK